MALLIQVNDLITNVLTNEFSEYIAEQFGLDSSQVSQTVKNYLAQSPSKPVLQEKVEMVALKKVEGNGKCPFVSPRDSSGTPCGVTIRGDFQYCSKHRFRKNCGASIEN